jgi:hypothetical protein
MRSDYRTQDADGLREEARKLLFGPDSFAPEQRDWARKRFAHLMALADLVEKTGMPALTARLASRQ